MNLIRRIAVRDLDTGTMIPVGDPENWRFVRMLMSSAEMLDGFVPHRVAIHELVESGIWNAEWTFESVPQWPEDNSDAAAIVGNDDRCR